MGYACELETSYFLHLRPDLVHMDRAVDEVDFVATPNYTMDWIEGGALIAYPLWTDDTISSAGDCRQRPPMARSRDRGERQPCARDDAAQPPPADRALYEENTDGGGGGQWQAECTLSISDSGGRGRRSRSAQMR